VTLTHATELKKRGVTPTVEAFPITEHEIKSAQTFVQKVQARAYGAAKQQKRIKVLINPFGGKGKALKYWTNDIEPIFRAARCEIEVVRTTHSKHAEEIGEAVDVEKTDVVACCSGDGVPYEVWNGLGRKTNAGAALANVAVVQLPCGTGNALSVSCNGSSNPSRAALAVVKGIKTRVDLASITQGEKRTLSFLSQSYGIVAECDLLTEDLRWLGDMRFTVGFIKRIFRKTVWPCDLAIGVEIADKNDIQRDYRLSFELPAAHSPIPPDTLDELRATIPEVDTGFAVPESEGLPPLKYGTINDPLPTQWELTPFPNLGNLYSGNMPFMAADANFFTFARIDEGMLDLVTVRGDISPLRSLAMMLSVPEGRLWQQKEVTYRKVSGFRVVPRDPEDRSVVSVDGEKYPFKPFQVEVHKGLGCTLTPAGRYVRPDEIV
jgi:sphingosine kinase